MKIINSENATNEHGTIHKPTDFITDSRIAPKGIKRGIGIQNVAGNDYEKIKHDYDHLESNLDNKQQPLI